MDIVQVEHKHAKCYLIGAERRFVLLDACWPDALFALEAAMKKNGIDYADVAAMIVTHFHPDHAGLVRQLQDRGVALWLHPNQVGFDAWLNDFFVRHPDRFYRAPRQDGAIVVTTGQSKQLLAGLGLRGALIPTPGHSKDSVSLVFDDVCAFTGDHPHADYAQGFGDETISKSWARIRSHRVSLIYPAHGAPYRLPQAGSAGYGS